MTMCFTSISSVINFNYSNKTHFLMEQLKVKNSDQVLVGVLLKDLI